MEGGMRVNEALEWTEDKDLSEHSGAFRLAGSQFFGPVHKNGTEGGG